MRYIVLVAIATAALWMLEGNSRPSESVASPTSSTTHVDDLGRIVIVGHRNAS
jgi:hypothetical protein